MFFKPEQTIVSTVSGAGDNTQARIILQCHVIRRLVAGVMQIPLCELEAVSRRKAPVARARQIAMYLAHVGCGLSLTDVGRGFQRDRTTVAHACASIEDARDCAQMDDFLNCLELVARGSCQKAGEAVHHV